MRLANWFEHIDPTQGKHVDVTTEEQRMAVREKLQIIHRYGAIIAPPEKKKGTGNASRKKRRPKGNG